MAIDDHGRAREDVFRTITTHETNPTQDAREAALTAAAPGRAKAGSGRVPPEAPGPDRLALRLDDIAATLGVSRRAIERERSAGRLPKPDRTIGRIPLWRVETIHDWLAGGGR